MGRNEEVKGAGVLGKGRRNWWEGLVGAQEVVKE